MCQVPNNTYLQNKYEYWYMLCTDTCMKSVELILGICKIQISLLKCDNAIKNHVSWNRCLATAF